MTSWFNRITNIVWMVVFLAWSGCGTPVQPGTPMNSTCKELPTVEECREGANAITNERLWDCIRQQCTRIKIRCGDLVRVDCKKRSQQQGETAMGFTLVPTWTTTFNPTQEIFWCEESTGRDCRTDAMVHELAHSCGWRHEAGLGVPGNMGRIACE